MGKVATATAPADPGQDERSPWPVRGLSRRLRRALDFARVAVEDFGDAGYVDDTRPALGFGPEKVVAEAAMLAHAVHGCTDDPEIDDRLTALTAQLAPRVRSRAALADIALNPDRAFSRAVPHVLLSRLGSTSSAFDAFAADRCTAVLRYAVEQPAVVLAERRWLCSLWPRLCETEVPRADGSAMDMPLDLRVENREEAYALTHLLFYVTDFARRPPDGALTRDRDALLADVEGLLARYLDHGDYDLVGELLMAWPELRVPWSPAAAFAFRVLADVEDTVGLLPCGNVDPVRLAALSGSERTRYARATSYHTAFVMGFLSAAALRTRLPTAQGHSAVVPAAPQAFRALVDDDTSHWLGIYDASPREVQSELAPLLRDLVLTQSLRRQDLARASEALELAAALGMPASAMERAATDRLWAIQRATEIDRT
jgi:hypothetical protein